MSLSADQLWEMWCYKKSRRSTKIFDIIFTPSYIFTNTQGICASKCVVFCCRLIQSNLPILFRVSSLTLGISCPTPPHLWLVPRFVKYPLRGLRKTKHSFFNRSRWFCGAIKHAFLSKTYVSQSTFCEREKSYIKRRTFLCVIVV